MNTKPASQRPSLPPQQPQQPQQHPQLSGKRHDFLESIPPCCGGCVAAEDKMKLEVVRETAATGKPLRLPYLTPGGDLVIPFDSDPKYHWWKGGQSVASTRAEVLARMVAERAGHNG